MTDKNLVIVENPPAVFTAGSVEAYGSLDVDAINLAAELARKTYRAPDDVAEIPDDIARLREDVNALSDALANVTGQLYQIASAIKSGRIAVVPLAE